MTQEDKVTSLELSKKLRDAGMPQKKSYFQWVLRKGKWVLWNPTDHSDYETRIEKGWVDAPDCAELSEDRLPDFIGIGEHRHHLYVRKVDIGGFSGGYSGLDLFRGNTLVEFFGKVLLWCLENGHCQKDNEL